MAGKKKRLRNQWPGNYEDMAAADISGMSVFAIRNETDRLLRKVEALGPKFNSECPRLGRVLEGAISHQLVSQRRLNKIQAGKASAPEHERARAVLETVGNAARRRLQPSNA